MMYSRGGFRGHAARGEVCTTGMLRDVPRFTMRAVPNGSVTEHFECRDALTRQPAAKLGRHPAFGFGTFDQACAGIGECKAKPEMPDGVCANPQPLPILVAEGRLRGCGTGIDRAAKELCHVENQEYEQYPKDNLCRRRSRSGLADRANNSVDDEADQPDHYCSAEKQAN